MRAKPEDKNNNLKKISQDALVGAGAAIPRLCVTQPFASLLARVQADQSKTISSIALSGLKERGPLWFYDGGKPMFARFVLSKTTGVPVMTWANSKTNEILGNKGISKYLIKPIIAGLIMGGHDTVVFSYLNYKFFSATIGREKNNSGIISKSWDVALSSRALPFLQTGRWLGFFITRQFSDRLSKDYGLSPLNKNFLSGFLGASLNTTFIPFFERTNTELNKNIQSKKESVFTVMIRLYKEEGIAKIYKRGSGLIFCNAAVTLAIWDIILSYTSKKKEQQLER